MAKTLRGEADLLHGPVLQNMLRFALPILAGTLLQQLYSMVDAVVVGQFVGKTALAAVGGSAVAIINLLLNFFVGLCSGAAIVVATIPIFCVYPFVSKYFTKGVMLGAIKG